MYVVCHSYVLNGISSQGLLSSFCYNTQRVPRAIATLPNVPKDVAVGHTICGPPFFTFMVARQFKKTDLREEKSR